LKTVAGISFLILVLSLVVYFLIFSRKELYQDNIRISPADHVHKIYSMREIDSISAEMNYTFTVKNAVTHSHNDSLKVPVSTEKPAI
jgi:hypothetical protein